VSAGRRGLGLVDLLDRAGLKLPALLGLIGALAHVVGDGLLDGTRDWSEVDGGKIE
jgi:hypothetical protein